MPIYEYECDACGHHMEVLQKFSDLPIAECEACHSHQIKKLISQSTFHLKGTGWYVTDYASKSNSGRRGGKQKGSGGGEDTASVSQASEPKSKAPTPSKTDE